MANVNHEEILTKMLDGRNPEELSDEEVVQIMSALERGVVPEAPKPEVKAETKPNVVEMPRRPEPAPQPQAPAKPNPEWDYDRFAKSWLDQKDPLAALDYAAQSRMGMPVFQTVPALVAGFHAMAQELAELKTRTFAGNDPSEVAVLEQIIAENGLQRSAKGYEAARKIAKADGLLGKRDEATVEAAPSRPSPPPRLPRGQSSENFGNEEQRMVANAENLSDAALESLAQRFGIVTQSHLS